MSDLNDLIHTNATIAFNQGIIRERERITKILVDHNNNKTHSEHRYCGLCEAIELVKGDQK